MKLTLIAAITCSLAPAIALTAARCPPQSNSWQCQDRGGSSSGSGTGTGMQLPPTTAQPGTQTPPLGGVDPTHNQVVLKPLPPQVITGTSKPPAVTATYGGEFTGTGVLTINVTDTRPTLIGYGKPPEPTIQPTPSFTGTSQVPQPQPQTPIVVTPTPQPIITGYGKPPEPTVVPTPSFTGTSQQPPQPTIVVTPTPQPTITGYGKPPEPTVVPTPSFTGTSQQPPKPQIVVVPITAPAFVGYGKPPQPSILPTPSFTGVRPPQPIFVVATQPPGVGNLGTTAPQPGATPGHTAPGAGHSGQPAVPGKPGANIPAPGLAPAQPNPPRTPQPPDASSQGPMVQPPQGGTNGTGDRLPGAVLIVHNPPAERPVTSGVHIGATPYSLEYIEPGIQNHKVEVYRSKDVRQVTYQDANAQSQGGFHLRVIGIRNPDYAH